MGDFVLHPPLLREDRPFKLEDPEMVSAFESMWAHVLKTVAAPKGPGATQHLHPLLFRQGAELPIDPKVVRPFLVKLAELTGQAATLRAIASPPAVSRKLFDDNKRYTIKQVEQILGRTEDTFRRWRLNQPGAGFPETKNIGGVKGSGNPVYYEGWELNVFCENQIEMAKIGKAVWVPIAKI